MAKFFYETGSSNFSEVEVVSVAGQPGDREWFVVTMPVFSSFDPQKQVSQYWAFAVRNKDGSYRRNETMHFSSKPTRQDVIEWCVKSGHKMLVEA